LISWTPGVTIEALEEQVIMKAIAHYRNKEVAAAALGIARRTIDYKLEKYAEEQRARDEISAEQKRKDDEHLQRARGIFRVESPVNELTAEQILAKIESDEAKATTAKESRKIKA